MRPDMDRVVIERPRACGGGIRHPKGSRKAEAHQFSEDATLPKRQGLRQRWLQSGSRVKEFTDVLGPLRGYAMSVIGRPWAKVYSEISKVFSMKATATWKVKTHARQHLWQFLTPPWKVIIVNGQSYERRNLVYLGNEPKAPGFPIYDDQAYADPHDGIIKRGTFKRKKYRWKPKRQTVVKQGRHFKLLHGVWYEILMADVPPIVREWIPSQTRLVGEIEPRPYFYPGHWIVPSGRVIDILLGDLSRVWNSREDKIHEALRTAYGVVKYAVGKKQINSREIRQLGLPKQY